MLIGEVTLSASRTHLTTLYTVASDNATLSRRVTELVGREEPVCPDNGFGRVDRTADAGRSSFDLLM